MAVVAVSGVSPETAKEGGGVTRLPPAPCSPEEVNVLGNRCAAVLRHSRVLGARLTAERGASRRGAVCAAAGVVAAGMSSARRAGRLLLGENGHELLAKSVLHSENCTK